MRALKSWKTILGAAILTLGALALLLPATSFGGIGEVPNEHWVRSAEAIQKDNEGFCDAQPGTICFQNCIDFQGQDHLMPYFECH